MSDSDRYSKTSILGVLSAHAELHPDRICFGSMTSGTSGNPEVEITFSRLSDMSRRAARTLKERGAVPGDRVILAVHDPLQFVGAFFGTLAAGLVAVPLPAPGEFGTPTAAIERVLGVCEDCRPTFFIIESRERWSRVFGDSIPDSQLIEVNELGFDPESEAEATGSLPELEDFESDLPAVIQYTSGSTGRPRGVVVTHGNFMANARGIGEAAGMTVDHEVLVSWLPLHHDMGLVAGLFVTVLWRMRTYLGTPSSFISRPVSWLQAIHNRRATLSVAPTFAYNLCYQRLSEQSLRGLDLSSWRVAFIGAEAVGTRTALGFIDRFRDHGFDPRSLYPVYGLAEATLAVTTPRPLEGTVIDNAEIRRYGRKNVAVPTEEGSDRGTQYVALGRPLPGHEVMIINPETSEVCGPREVGEIVVKGPSVTPGYFGRTEGRRERLHTGDLGYFSDGRLYFVERLKDLIIIAGQNFAPVDIEACVTNRPELEGERLAAFSTEDVEQGTESFALVVEVGAKHRRIIDDLKISIAREIRRRFGLTPAEILFVTRGTLKRTTSGKIQRAACREMYLDGSFELSRHQSRERRQVAVA